MTYYPDLSGNNKFGVRLGEIAPPADEDGVPSGSSFPLAPVINSLFFHTGYGEIFTHDGTRWLSTAQYSIELHSRYGQDGVAATQTLANVTNPLAGASDMWVESATFSRYCSVAGGSWTLTILTRDGAATATLATSAAFANTDPANEVVQVNAVVSKDIDYFGLTATENSGAVSCFAHASMRYRVIGV